MNRKQDLGQRGEDIAHQFLLSKGFQILDRNWRSPEGEIDLVATEEEMVVFVEVKTRTSHEFGWPEESITRFKRRRLQRAAMTYLEAHDKLNEDWRIDVIAIDLTHAGSVVRIEHYMNAIEEDTQSS